MREIKEKWFPAPVKRSDWEKQLVTFYENHEQYHVMTAGSGDKVKHPQVGVLLSLIQPGRNYVEVGCGSGIVCSLVAERASITGLDVSPLAINKARERCANQRAVFQVGEASRLPLDDNVMDGVYSFEVLEHLWNPVVSLKEMIRVVRPGGFVLVSTPNLFSLDLHLTKRPLARAMDVGFAGLRYLHDKILRTSFVNLMPDLDADSVYPDCDMVSSLVPCNLERTILSLGCNLEFMDTYYMCSLSMRRERPLSFQRFSGHPFLKWFGDHILFLVRKNEPKKE